MAVEDLEAWLASELPPARAAALHHHVGICDHCAAELTWLRTEQALLVEPVPAVAPTALWCAVAARLTLASTGPRTGAALAHAGPAVRRARPLPAAARRDRAVPVLARVLAVMVAVLALAAMLWLGHGAVASPPPSPPGHTAGAP
jgi:hypothetical protein